MSNDAGARTRPKEASTWRPHVVIITDDHDLREFLGQGLLYAGFWTSAIASGLQAIEVFRLRRFDLILVDAGIGGLSAPEMIRRLRTGTSPDGTPLTSVPIVAIAEGSHPADEAWSEVVGADLILRPPLELDQVATALFRTIGEWRAANPDVPWADAPLPQSRGPRGEEPS